MTDKIKRISKVVAEALELNEAATFNNNPKAHATVRTLNKLKPIIVKELFQRVNLRGDKIEEIDWSQDGFIYNEKNGTRIAVNKNALIINVTLEAGKAYGDSYCSCDIAHYTTDYDVYKPNQRGDILVYKPVNDTTFGNTYDTDLLLWYFLRIAKEELYNIGIYRNSYWREWSVFKDHLSPLELERTKKIFPKHIYIVMNQYHD